MKDLLKQREIRKEYHIGYEKLKKYEDMGLKTYRVDQRTVLYSRKEFEAFLKNLGDANRMFA